MSGDALFVQLEGLARSNRWGEVESLIRDMERKKMRSMQLVALAAMARRAYKLPLAITLLKPLVLTPDGQIENRADDKALAEYATCLTMLGARKSALRVLKCIKKVVTEGLFAWVTYHFSHSEYSEAIPYLLSYIDLVDDEYKQKVGELNLCACYVYIGDYDQAEPHLSRLQDYFQKNAHRVLLANSHELHSQVLIARENWIHARGSLAAAEKLMEQGNALYSLFIKKWNMVCDLKTGAGSLTKLLKLVGEAQGLEHYHSVRELFFYYGETTQDEAILSKVYFGTPFASYRQSVLKKAPALSLCAYLPWNGDWLQGEWTETLAIEKNPLPSVSLSNLEQKALEVLTNDFYEPLSIGAVFDELFPGEQLDPQYSLPKTYKVLQRLHQKLQKGGVGISIANSNSRYSLDFSEGWMIPKPNPDHRKLYADPSEFRLVQTFSGKTFTRGDVMTVFAMKRATSLRWLKELGEKGMIECVGSGPAAFYRLSA